MVSKAQSRSPRAERPVKVAAEAPQMRNWSKAAVVEEVVVVEECSAVAKEQEKTQRRLSDLLYCCSSCRA